MRGDIQDLVRRIRVDLVRLDNEYSPAVADLDAVAAYIVELERAARERDVLLELARIYGAWAGEPGAKWMDH